MNLRSFALLSVIAMMLAASQPLEAVTPVVYIRVCDFGGVNAIPSSDLARGPCGKLIGVTYGNAAADGTGSVFEFNPNGNGTYAFRSIYRFNISGSPANDGQYPYAGLAVSGNTVFGTTQNGGVNGAGVLYSIDILQAELNPNGNPSGYNILTPFSGTLAGSLSRSTLKLGGYDNFLFGSLSSGGPLNNGSLIVYDRSGQTLNVIPFGGGIRGADPFGKLTFARLPMLTMPPHGVQSNATTNVDLSTITIYGVTRSGGSNNWGTVYRVQANGSNFMVLHHFNFSSTDGAMPQGGMVLQSNILYGTTSSGGANYAGTVFKVSTNGSGFQIIGNFDSAATGSSPQGDLIRDGSTLYGTTYGGGTGGGGTAYAIDTDGGNFQPLHSFSTPRANGSGGYTNSDGGWSVEGLLLSDHILFGTTPYGGSNGVGTAYEIILPSPPELRIAPTNGNYNISWPSYASGYALQQNSSLASTGWTMANHPLSTNGLMSNVTIAPAKGNLFFRLVNTNGP